MNTASWVGRLAAVVGLVGLWLVVGPPFLFEAPFADFWSDLLVGTALVVLAAYTYARRDTASSRWSAAAAAVLGGWLVVGAYLWQTSTFLHWHDVVAGAVVALVGGVGAYGAHTAHAGNGSGDSDDDGDGESNGGGSDDGSDGDDSDERR
jgi:uncharacterized membrane protein YgcG